MNRSAVPMAVFTALLALAAAACGRATEPSETGAADVPMSPSPEDPMEALPEQTVLVRLVDFVVEPNAETAAAGTVTFDVRNDGQAIGDDGEPIPTSGGGHHNLFVLRTELPPDALPQELDTPGRPVDVEAPGVDVVDFVPIMSPGSTATLTTDLESGSYVLLCNLVDHYERGMWSTFSVR